MNAGGHRPMVTICLLGAALVFQGCGRYSDFTLPQLSGEAQVSFALETLPEPVLTRGADWDSRDVLNPSVVRGSAGSLLNFYSGFDGATWRTGTATSEDGIHWRKLGLILSPDPKTWEAGYIAANGSALLHEGRWWYWYQAGAKERPRIGVMNSPDGPSGPAAPRKQPDPSLDYGPYMSWDERAVADPSVIRIGDYFYMYYLGQDRGDRQRLGVARSTDGISWDKLRSNPILDLGEPGTFDENGLGEPAVWVSHDSYWMLYTGRDAVENRRLGLAQSADGVHWRKLPAVFAGSQAWNSKVLCDPSVDLSGNDIRVWFGGGDAPSPDENLNGQIGYGVLHPVVSTGEKQ